MADRIGRMAAVATVLGLAGLAGCDEGGAGSWQGLATAPDAAPIQG
jgi:hypothetical protein